MEEDAVFLNQEDAMFLAFVSIIHHISDLEISRSLHPIPVIDLRQVDRAATVQQILKASQDIGFFQVINHGADEELIKNTMSVLKDLFKVPAVDKASGVYSEDPSRSCRLCNNILSYEGQKIALWLEDLRLYCNPLQKHIQEWPQNPLTYREVVGKYTEEITKLGSRIFELICEGLGLESGYFEVK